MARESTYPVALRGLATNFEETEVPLEFATKFRNRFLGPNGSAEKRQGLQRLSAISGVALDSVHELVGSDGTATLFVSGDGKIYKFSGAAFSLVHSVSSTLKLRSNQMGDKLIFYNGVNRDFFTEDGSTFANLKAIVEQGEMSSVAVSGAIGHFTDVEITNWITGTNVAVNDIVYNVSLDAFGIVTAVASAQIEHQIIGSAGVATGLGVATRNPVDGDRYEVIDLVELNIIPTDGQPDNVALAGGGTSATIINVSGVNFSTTEIKTGDFIRNTVHAAVCEVVNVGAGGGLTVTSVSGQSSGDSLVFLKSAMPISKYAHIHYGRRYSVDVRDQRKIRISGANIPTDMTEDAGTLDAITFSFGTQQPDGNVVKSLTSYQRFLVMGGSKAVLVFQGTVPIGTDADFTPVGLFPQGVVSPDALLSIGNDATVLSDDGLQSLQLAGDSSSLNRLNFSEQIRNKLRDLIAASDESSIVVRHYPKRSFILCKVGSEVYVYNYGALFTSRGFVDRFGTDGSWSLFDGLFATQADFFERANGDLITVDALGRVYLFDQGTYDDDGQSIPTAYQTPWLSTEEPRKFVRRKSGKYIKPIFEADPTTDIKIVADSDYRNTGVDTVTVRSSGKSIGGWEIGADEIGSSGIGNTKYPLRWVGEVVRLEFTSDDTNGPDILSRYTIYSSSHGRR